MLRGRLPTTFSLLERKISHDGVSVQSFRLEGFMAKAGRAVVGRWRASGPHRESKQNFGLEPGSVSWGVWPLGSNRCWGAYRLHGPDGTLQGYRFDALTDVTLRSLGEEEGYEVTFRDLLLDCRIHAERPFETCIEDENEVLDALRKGSLSDSDIKDIENARIAFASSNASALAKEVDAWIEEATRGDNRT